MRALVIALVCISSIAHARRIRVKRRPLVRVVQKRETSEPPAGTCVYRQAGVKFCSVLADGQGVFDLHAAWPGYLHVRFDDPIENFIQPDPRFFQSDKLNNTVTIIPVSQRLPAHSWQATVTTASVTVTLNIIPGVAGRADAQVTIVDPRRGERKGELKAIETRAQARALEIADGKLLDDLIQGGASLRRTRGKTISRNAQLIVLRSQDLVQIGSKSFLTFSLENRSADDFEPRKIRLWIGKQEVAPIFRIEHTPIAPNEEVRGVLGVTAPVRGKACRLVVEETDSRRNVELAKLELP